MLGNAIRMPSKEAGAEDRVAFKKRLLEVGKNHGVVALPGEGEDDTPLYRALGAPEKPEGYELPDVQVDGLQFDPSEADLFRGVAHQAGVTNKQFKKIVSGMAKARESGALEAKTGFEKGLTALKTEWGQAYDQRMGEVTKMLETHGAPAGLKAAWGTGRVEASSAKWLYEVLSAFGGEPGELRRQGKGDGSVKLTPAEALERVGEVEKRLHKMNAGDPEYDVLVKRRVELMGLAYPE